VCLYIYIYIQYIYIYDVAVGPLVGDLESTATIISGNGLVSCPSLPGKRQLVRGNPSLLRCTYVAEWLRPNELSVQGASLQGPSSASYTVRVRGVRQKCPCPWPWPGAGKGSSFFVIFVAAVATIAKSFPLPSLSHCHHCQIIAIATSLLLSNHCHCHYICKKCH
jgi:hypothetical protein